MNFKWEEISKCVYETKVGGLRYRCYPEFNGRFRIWLRSSKDGYYCCLSGFKNGQLKEADKWLYDYLLKQSLEFFRLTGFKVNFKDKKPKKV